MNKIKITTSVKSITDLKPLRIHGLYDAQVSVPRTSGTHDTFQIICSSEISYQLSALCSNNHQTNAAEQLVTLRGELRSRNENGHLYVYMWVTAVKPVNRANYASIEVQLPANAVELTGALCTQPTLRKTPNGYTISDAILVVKNAAETRNYYLPIIAWGSTAHDLAAHKPGDTIALKGRFQSRTYSKGATQNTSYEVSINELTS